MLFDLLGALLGFSTVMLLLSLVVTALVEATQSMIRLRSRNLRWGLRRLLEEEGLAPKAEAAIAATKLMKVAAGSAHPLAVRELDAPALGKMLDDVRKLEDRETDAVTTTNPGLPAGFARMERNTSDRYRRWIRALTIGWAIAIAGLYQVSAPELLQRLSEDPALRERYAAAAGAAAVQARETLEFVAADGSIELEALKELGKDHPEIAAQLAEGADPDELVAGIEVTAEGSDDDELALLNEFDQIQSRLNRERVDLALQQAAGAGSQLSALGIQTLEHGRDFYLRPSNLAGMAMTAILLTLGAPFWYQQITTLTRLRGIFAPSKEKK